MDKDRLKSNIQSVLANAKVSGESITTTTEKIVDKIELILGKQSKLQSLKKLIKEYDDTSTIPKEKVLNLITNLDK